VPFDDEVVDVGGVEGVEGLEGEVVDLLRCRSDSTYPDLALIPMSGLESSDRPAVVRFPGRAVVTLSG
jgi:hypothetical protein